MIAADDFEAANAAILGYSPRRALEDEREYFERKRRNEREELAAEYEREDENARRAAEFLSAKWRG